MRERSSSTLIARIFLIACVCLISQATNAQARSCSAAEADAADAAVADIDSWPAVAFVAKKYRHCDDGSIAEGSSEAVARLLVDHWDQLSVLNKLSQRDPELRRFVLRHVDSTLDTDDLQKLHALVTRKCPKGVAGLCRDLGAQVKTALE